MIGGRSFQKVSLAEAFHVMRMYFLILCLGIFFNISINEKAMEA